MREQEIGEAKRQETPSGERSTAKKSEQGDETADSESRRKLWQKTTQILFWKYFSHFMLVSTLL